MGRVNGDTVRCAGSLPVRVRSSALKASSSKHLGKSHWIGRQLLSGPQPTYFDLSPRTEVMCLPCSTRKFGFSSSVKA